MDSENEMYKSLPAEVGLSAEIFRHGSCQIYWICYSITSSHCFIVQLETKTHTEKNYFSTSFTLSKFTKLASAQFVSIQYLPWVSYCRSLPVFWSFGETNHQFFKWQTQKKLDWYSSLDEGELCNDRGRLLSSFEDGRPTSKFNKNCSLEMLARSHVKCKKFLSIDKW